jgi:hypothetical protein
MAGTRSGSRQAPQRLILDSGAVIALARGPEPVEIPVVVVAETIRGGDAPVHRVLKAVGSVPAAREAHGRTIGGSWERPARQEPWTPSSWPRP